MQCSGVRSYLEGLIGVGDSDRSHGWVVNWWRKELRRLRGEEMRGDEIRVEGMRGRERIEGGVQWERDSAAVLYSFYSKWKQSQSLQSVTVNIKKCNVLYCTALHCAARYCTVLYCTALFTVLYCTVLYCTALYCAILYCTESDDSPSDKEDASGRIPSSPPTSLAATSPGAVLIIDFDWTTCRGTVWCSVVQQSVVSSCVA